MLSVVSFKKHKPQRPQRITEEDFPKDGLPASHRNVRSRVTFLLLPAINSSERRSAESEVKALEHEPDERLLIEAAQSEPARFADLYDRNFDRIYAFFARRVVTREEAQDLTAEVFHQALASIGKFK